MSEEVESDKLNWSLENQVKFHLKEYECLKSEIAALDAAKRTLQLLTVGAVSGVAAWLVTNKDTVDELEARVAWWIPFFVSILGFMISRTYVRSAKEIGVYIGRLEKFSAHSNLGWEKTIGERRRTRGKLTSRREAIAWSVILAASFVVGVVFGIPQLMLR